MRRDSIPPGLTVLLLAVLGLLFASPADAQQLPLKRELPAGSDEVCAPPPTSRGAPEGVEPSPDDLARAEVLAVQANQAAILGDHDRARGILMEAAFLNPNSGTIAFRLGRSLEALGALADAQAQYCRYLALVPDATDRDEVESHIESLATETAGGASPAARRAFEQGLQAFDAGDPEEAVRAFTTAISESPNWPEPHYNRGVLRVELARLELGAADLERYLELAVAPADGPAVQARLEEMRERIVATRSPTTTLATGLLMPGLGHFYTDRSRTGLVFLTLAGASAGTGFFVKEVEVACRTPPVGGQCPPNQVAGTTENRPYLGAGLAGAAAVTIVGAIHAYVGSRRARAEVSLAGLSTGPPGLALHPGASIRVMPILGVREASAGVTLSVSF